MKRIFQILMLSLTVTLLFACRHEENYDFLYEADKIQSIEIVEVSFDEKMELILTEIATVGDIEMFMNDFFAVDCFTYYGDPLGVCEEGSKTNAIKITYENEEYELINWNGQTTYTTEDGISFYEGYRVFDESEFQEILEKYSK